jgi:MFS family permease
MAVSLGFRRPTHSTSQRIAAPLNSLAHAEDFDVAKLQQSRKTLSPERLTRSTAVACFLVPVALCVITSAKVNPGVLGGALLNPDSAMRLVRLDAILAAHAPLHTVMRDGSGLGTVLHWSHLLDSLLLLLAAPLAWATGWPTALRGVAMLFGPLSMGLLGIAVCWAAAPFAGGPANRRTLWLGSLAIGLATPVLAYGIAGEVHHHVLLASCAAMTAGWAARCIRRDGAPAGCALGAWAGAGLWLSPESLPFSLMAIGAVWAAWFLRPNSRGMAMALVASGLSMTVVTGLAWLVDPPLAGYGAAEPDRLSAMYVILACGAVLCAGLAWASLRQSATRARLQAAFGAAAAAAAWLATYPEVLRGTQGLMSQDQAQAFFSGINEMMPVDTVQVAFEFLAAGVIGAGFLLTLGIRQRSALVLYAAACAVILLLLGALHVRFAVYSAVLAAGLLAIAVANLAGLMAAFPERTRMLARVALLALMFLLPKLGNIVAPAQAETASGDPAACRIEDAASLLAPYAGEVVLSPVNDVPDLLRRTGVLTVGSLYHRNVAGFMRLRAAWRSVPGKQVPAELDAALVSLVLICPSQGRSALVDGLPAETLEDRLIARQPPPWLTLIGGRRAGGYMLYRVVP